MMPGEMWEEPAIAGDIQGRFEGIAGLIAPEEMSRRDFLKIAALTAAALALPVGCGTRRSPDPRSGERDEWRVVDLKAPPAPAGRATVGIARKGDIAETVRRAIELAGGLDEIKSGDTVVIKPNLTTGYTLSARVTTHPEVLRAVIRAVKERTDAGNITVAEASAYTDPSTLEVARKVGVYDVVQSEGVNFLAFEDEEYVEATSYHFRNLNFILHIPRSLTDSTFKHFINVPMLKNHEAIKQGNADYTCCIKNHVGLLSREKRIRGGGKGIHRKDMGEKIAELNLAAPVHTMNVVDALTVILTGGPAALNMQWVDPGLILACRDRVACDSVGLAVLRYHAARQGIKRPYTEKSVWEQAQITRAQELNLGRKKNRIRVESDGVDEIDGIRAFWA